jgi:glycosyltransferase involved in cell wall biosynthesis
MAEGQTNLLLTTENFKSLRLVLIASGNTVADHSLYLRNLLGGILGEKISVALVCPRECDVDLSFIEKVEIIRYPAIDLALMRHYDGRILIENVRRFKPNVIHCLCEDRSYIGGKLARNLDLPYILTVNSLQKRWGRISVSYKRLAKIIVPSRSIADNVSRLYPRFAKRVEQINVGNIVDKSSGCFQETSRLASIVVEGPCEITNGYENFLRAIKHLVVNGYEFVLVVIGGGRAERELRKMLNSLGLSEIAVIVPRQEPWREVLKAGDIFILPEPSEYFNHMLLEAMSVGVAVAGCKGGVDDLLIENETGLIFNRDDELSIYGRIQELLDRRETAKRLAKTSKDYLSENHAVDGMVSKMLGVYREAHRLKKK